MGKARSVATTGVVSSLADPKQYRLTPPAEGVLKGEKPASVTTCVVYGNLHLPQPKSHGDTL